MGPSIIIKTIVYTQYLLKLMTKSSRSPFSFVAKYLSSTKLFLLLISCVGFSQSDKSDLFTLLSLKNASCLKIRVGFLTTSALRG